METILIFIMLIVLIVLIAIFIHIVNHCQHDIDIKKRIISDSDIIIKKNRETIETNNKILKQ